MKLSLPFLTLGLSLLIMRFAASIRSPSALCPYLRNFSRDTETMLCKGLLNRKCLKCQIQATPITAQQWEKANQSIKERFPLNAEDLAFLCFKGTVSNTLYKNDNETIKILLKSGEIANISSIQNALIIESLSAPVKKFYICLLNE